MLFVQPAHTTDDEEAPSDESVAPPMSAAPSASMAPLAAEPLSGMGEGEEVVPVLHRSRSGRPSSGHTRKPLAAKDTNRAASAKETVQRSMHASKSAPALVKAPLAQAEGRSPSGEASLTVRGTAQCMLARQEWFGRLPVRKVLLSSPVLCARETALHMAGRLDEAASLAVKSAWQSDESQTATATKPVAPPLCICSGLAPRHPPSACDELVAQKTRHQHEVGLYATAPPLRLLLDAEGGESAFGMYAEGACEELTAALRDAMLSLRGKRDRDTYVSIFGHPGLNHAIAYAVAAAAGMRSSDLEALLNLKLGDAEGVLIPLYAIGKQAIQLKRPK